LAQSQLGSESKNFSEFSHGQPFCGQWILHAEVEANFRLLSSALPPVENHSEMMPIAHSDRRPKLIGFKAWGCNHPAIRMVDCKCFWPIRTVQATPGNDEP
jgi:hypothetical protein